MKYQVIESKIWKHKLTGATVSIYGASPWTSPTDKVNWSIEVRGWTVLNPYTNEVGIGRVPWGTKEAAQNFADTHKPNTTLMYL